jgi:hypothetical protein
MKPSSGKPHTPKQLKTMTEVDTKLQVLDFTRRPQTRARINRLMKSRPFFHHNLISRYKQQYNKP